MSRIVFLIPTIDRIGGAECQVLLLASQLRRRGHTVTVVALSGTGGEAAIQLRSSGVDFLSLFMRKGLADPRGWLQWIRWLYQERPDVVHAHLPHASWMARWARLFGPRTIVVDTVHTSATGRWGRKVGYRLSKFLPDLVTAVSDSVRENYVAAGMVLPRRSRVVPNGIQVPLLSDRPGSRREVRRQLGIAGEFVWLAIGRLEPVKNYPLMLEAFSLLPESTVLVIAGSGPLAHAVKQLAEDLGVAKRVRYLGFVKNLEPWLLAADGCVSTSEWEGLPMALLEAAAMGLPAVATDVCGNREAVVDRKTGLLGPPGDPEGFSRVLRAFMGMSEAERGGLANAGRQRVLEEYEIDSVCMLWESIYEELARTKKDRR